MISTRFLRLTAPAFAGLSLVLASALGAQGQVAAPTPTPAAPATTVPGPPAATPSTRATPIQRTLLQQMQDAFTNIALSAEPFVVNIKAAHSLNLTGDMNPAPSRPAPKAPKIPGAPVVPDSPSPFPKQEEATGSGLIVRADGYILTNDHVVEGAPYVTVTLSDGREYRGKVIPDYKSDLALVKIDPGTFHLPVAQFADSDRVQPGQWAIAIGSPFDLQNTMTVGVISAIHRHQTIAEDIANARYYPDLMQTDAAINPGNSGGPLLNIDGQVIGVNVAIESPVEGSAGVGFAIPAQTALAIMDQLINKGKVIRGYLGLAPDDLTPQRQQEYGITTGAWVSRVDKDSPAGKAGVHATDIITSYDGKPVLGELTLRNAISNTPPGQSVLVNLIRNGQPMQLTLTVSAPPASSTDNVPEPPPSAKVGVTFRNLKPSDRQELSLSPDINGAIVTAIAPNSPADQAGLTQNDIIEQIGRTPVTSGPQLSQALAALQPGDMRTLVVLRSEAGHLAEIAIDIKM